MYSRKENDEEDMADVTCNEVVGNTINCTVKNKGEDSSFSLKMEMEDSKNGIMITVTENGAAENLVLKASRL